MVVADDYHLEAGGEHYRFALFAFFPLCNTCGVPLSWNKTAGGETDVWVGFELLHSTHHLGISQRRAEWFTKWAREVADSDQVHMGRFEEGLGRIMYVVGRSSSSGLSSDPSIDSCRSTPDPQCAKFRPTSDSFSDIWLIGYQALGATTAQSRWKAQPWHHEWKRRQAARGLGSEDGFRTEDRTARSMSEGRLELNEEDWPWVYSRGRKPVLVISTLKSLAVLVALKLLYGEIPRERHMRVQTVPTITDNRGNGALLNNMMSTKFPASAVLMELASYMRRMSLRTVVEWAPREGNKEADWLANGNAEDFDPSLRIDVSASTLSWDILPEALEAGRAAERQSQAGRERGALPGRCRRGKRRRPEERLRLKDPR